MTELDMPLCQKLLGFEKKKGIYALCGNENGGKGKTNKTKLQSKSKISHALNVRL